jgi:preprotein translocase subunit SecE
MAVFKSNANIESNLNETISSETVKQDIMLWKNDSFKGILKAIQWPKFTKALQYTVYSMIASGIIGGILYIYGYGINQLISLFV